MTVQVSPAPKPGDVIVVQLADLQTFLERYGMEIVAGSYHAGAVVIRKAGE